MTKQIQETENTPVWEIFKALGNPVALRMFKHITNVGNWSPNGDISIVAGTEQKAGTKKMFYSNLGRLKSAGLVRKKAGKYCLTGYGRVIAAMGIRVEKAFEQRHHLRVVDSLEKSRYPEKEYAAIVDRLVPDQEIRDAVLRG